MHGSRINLLSRFKRINGEHIRRIYEPIPVVHSDSFPDFFPHEFKEKKHPGGVRVMRHSQCVLVTISVPWAKYSYICKYTAACVMHGSRINLLSRFVRV